MDTEIDSRIICITNRISHHAEMSGYDRLSEYLDANIILTGESLSLLQRVMVKSCRSIINRSGSKWYHRSNLVTELNAARQWISKKNSVFHFLYGENSFRYLGNMKHFNRKNRIFCTYHTPPNRFNDVVKNQCHLKKLDAAIVVSTLQIEFLSSILDLNRVFYVPHGVDTAYFRPQKSCKLFEHSEYFNCIFVGSHMRDFETLRRTAEILCKKDKRIRFIIITSHKNYKIFNNLDNVELYSSVQDHELLALYQSSNLLVLPLLDCTANNALLEGMACGLPIIATDLQGVRDYIDEECSILISPHDVDAMVYEIIAMADDHEKCKRMGVASRAKSIEYEWTNIAHHMKDIYKKFL